MHVLRSQTKYTHRKKFTFMVIHGTTFLHYSIDESKADDWKVVAILCENRGQIIMIQKTDSLKN